jgi:hypothetical protein
MWEFLGMNIEKRGDPVTPLLSADSQCRGY